MKNPIRITLVAAFAMACTGCVGAVVGAATDVVIETAKVPFKVGGAAIDVATPDKKKKESNDAE